MWSCYWCVVDRRPLQFNNDTPLRGARTKEHSSDNVIKLIIQALCLALVCRSHPFWRILQTAWEFSYFTNSCLPYGPLVKRLMIIIWVWYRNNWPQCLIQSTAPLKSICVWVFFFFCLSQTWVKSWMHQKTWRLQKRLDVLDILQRI